jgi:hypothetical protein
MVYMPSDVLGWRPAALSRLDQFLAQHMASATAAATEAAAAAAIPSPPVAAAAPGVLAAEPSELATPGSPTLPGFGKAGFDSFNAAARGAAGVDAAASTDTVPLQCPEGMWALRDCIRGMFDKFAQPLLQWVCSKGSLVLPMSDAALMTSLTTLLEIQLDDLHRYW